MLRAKKQKYFLFFASFITTAIILSVVQLKVSNPMILLERFIKFGGWVEILVMSFYAGFITVKMIDKDTSEKWRRITWTIFFIAFFSQLTLGLCGFENFLMKAPNLHLPIPALILGGSVYRMEISFMPILFLSTIILSGPAWCSQLCYFGANDNLAAKGKHNRKPLKNKWKIKNLILLLVIAIAIILRLFKVPIDIAIIVAASFGVVGVLIILLISTRKNKMIHCILYCPIGTIVSYTKYINPFRMYIDESCTNCMACTIKCNYDALNNIDIANRKPGLTCTLCGDCLKACHASSIKYKFFNLNSDTARNLYLVVTISLHAIFLTLARI